MKLATEFENLPEQHSPTLTVGDLIDYLNDEMDPDMPVVFVNYRDGHGKPIERMEVRKLTKDGGVVSRDHEELYPEAMPVFVLSVLG